MENEDEDNLSKTTNCCFFMPVKEGLKVNAGFNVLITFAYLIYLLVMVISHGLVDKMPVFFAYLLA